MDKTCNLFFLSFDLNIVNALFGLIERTLKVSFTFQRYRKSFYLQYFFVDDSPKVSPF
jgi:hypothetical protein